MPDPHTVAADKIRHKTNKYLLRCLLWGSILCLIVYLLTGAYWPALVAGIGFLAIVYLPYVYVIRSYMDGVFVVSCEASRNGLALTTVQANAKQMNTRIEYSDIRTAIVTMSYPAKYGTWAIFPWQELWKVEIISAGNTHTVTSACLRGEIKLDLLPNIIRVYKLLPM